MKMIWLKRYLLLSLVLPMVISDGDTSNAIDDNKHGRFLSLFSVVNFPNAECTLATDKIPGLCLTSSECESAAGSSQGTCAAGFGVCCYIRKNKCSDSLSKNLTYIENPSDLTQQSCQYGISPDQGICQIRLDFETFTVGAPDSLGTCTSGLTVTSTPTGTKLPTICGENSGQHIYFENAGSTSSVTLTFTAATTDAWKIRVSQIECFSSSRAPTDCFQYYTGPTGKIRSFNVGTMLAGLSYTVCLRQEEGFCKVDYSASQFGLGLTTDSPGTCTEVALLIPDSGSTSLYCGSYFTTAPTDTINSIVTDGQPPFTFNVISKTTLTNPGIGFELNYNQAPCQ